MEPTFRVADVDRAVNHYQRLGVRHGIPRRHLRVRVTRWRDHPSHPHRHTRRSQPRNDFLPCHRCRPTRRGYGATRESMWMVPWIRTTAYARARDVDPDGNRIRFGSHNFNLTHEAESTSRTRCRRKCQVASAASAWARRATLVHALTSTGAKERWAQARWPSSIGWTVASGMASASASCKSGRTPRSASCRPPRSGRRSRRSSGPRDTCSVECPASIMLRQSWRRISSAIHAGSRCERIPNPGSAGITRDKLATRCGGDGGQHRRLIRKPGAAVRNEPGRRRAQHQSGDEIAMPPPQQLRDRTAHRIADRDDGPGAELHQAWRRSRRHSRRAGTHGASAGRARVPAGRVRSRGNARRGRRTSGTNSGRRWRPTRAATAGSARRAVRASHG